MINRIFNYVISVFIFMMVASVLIKYTGLPFWAGSIFLVIIGLFLYFLNICLIKKYIQKRAPEFTSDEMWEFTAGMGIVPKWVSIIGLLSFPAFVAAIAWLITWIWPR